MPQTPAHLDDPVFGRLTWNPEFQWFEGKMEFSPKCAARVTFEAEDGQDCPKVVLKSREQVVSLRSRLSSIYSQVRAEFLALYNESWANAVNGYGQPANCGKINAEKFDELVRLETVSFQYGKFIELWYFDDDELFGGHSILVELDENLEIKRMGLEG